ncbi:methyl-accepting chemotaxis protein [Halomonas sp. NCCP-2165]|nr:methyl-accepting chemotaxis protein [Halomonas sp. NCCP-2165]GKW50622.1 methyl-accepting chemotaxis protein [Halomonas sp. NCCP-2165]
MRNNQPVTRREYPLDEHTFLISRTDLKGRITYANPAFVEVSGFSREELIGAPHNLVRHPDMPEAAFANLWETLKEGETWTGVVKNRCKNGDFYWVHASVTPIIENGETVGYASVRVKPSREEVTRAEAAYREIREGRGKRLTLHRGRLRRRGVMAKLKRVNLGSMRARISGMVAISMLLVLASGLLGLYGLQASGERLQALNRDGLQDVARLQQLDRLITAGYESLLTTNQMELVQNSERLVGELSGVAERLETVWGEYRDREVNHTPRADAFDEGLSAYIEDGILEMVSVLSSEDAFEIFTGAQQRRDNLQASGRELSAQVNGLIDDKQGAALVMAEEAAAGKQQMMLAQLSLLIVGLVLLVGLGALVVRSMIKALRESTAFTLQMAAGNLGANMPSRRRDEIGRLMHALDIMRKSLGSIVGDVNRGVSVVTPAARDIAQGNEDLSSRTEQQAASLQQTASSMEEMTTTVQQNADNARQASGLAVDNATQVGQAGELMGEVVQTMGRITEQSRKMTEIIDVIDSIAFQTNILALNASVEAARAGEQGRGFAVVAGEVRNLASRSSNAAGEIRQLIDGSAKEISSGASLVQRAEGAIEEVVAAATRVNDIMGEISSASVEQSSGINQINQAISQMDDVTQQNAALVQQSAAAASSLEHQALQLANAVSAFRLAGSGFEEIRAARAALAREHQRGASDQARLPRGQEVEPSRTPAAPKADAATEEWEAF